MSAKLKKFPSWIYIELITIGLALSSKFLLKLDANIGWLTFFIGTNITIVSNSLERKIISTVQEFTQSDGFKIYQLRSEIKDVELIPFAKQTIDKCIQELEYYKVGIGKVDHNRYSKKISQCQKSVKAIFWGEDVKKILNLQLNKTEDPLAFRYYEANIAAKKRGVTITRIFVLDQDNIVKEEFEEVWAFLQDHQKQGLTTRIIGIDRFKRIKLELEDNFTLVKIPYIHNPFQDFVIYDDSEIMIQDHIDHIAYSILIKNNKDTMETFKKLFDRLESNSISLEQFKGKHQFLK